MRSRQEIVCTFLAVLELIKLNRIAAVQDTHFGQIMVEPRKPDEPRPKEADSELDLEGESF
jgi:chromatin segregation and condensation protein Rec8/ScpA/Scc1 (kleisin family)